MYVLFLHSCCLDYNFFIAFPESAVSRKLMEVINVETLRLHDLANKPDNWALVLLLTHRLLCVCVCVWVCVCVCACVCLKSHSEVELIGPGADDSVLRRGPVGVLVLEDIVSSRSVAILVENHWCAGTSWNEHKQQMSERLLKMILLYRHIDSVLKWLLSALIGTGMSSTPTK